MALPTYPGNQLEDPDLLIGLCGSFWQESYGGRDQARAFADARGQLALQVLYDLQNLANIGGHATTPLFRRVRWFPWPVLLSQVVAVGTQTALPLPPSLAAVSVINDKVTNPLVTLINLVDFELDPTNNRFLFDVNPFDNPLWEVEPVLDENDVPIDQQITLWLFQCDFDELYLANNYGYVLNLEQPSTIGYQTLLNNVWDAMVGGTAKAQVDGLLTALTGARTAAADGEVVKYKGSDASGQFVITDQQVYRYNALATILVNVGDTLTQGQYIADTFETFDCNRGQVPASWPSITLPASYLLSTITGPLTFSNTSQATTYIANDGFGYAELQFPITGAGGDVSTFRTQFQARGRAINKTLAMCLDNRPQPQATQPGPTNVPAALNPAVLVAQNVLRYHTLLVTIQQNQLAPNALGLGQLAPLLRLIVPPWCAVLTRIV